MGIMVLSRLKVGLFLCSTQDRRFVFWIAFFETVQIVTFVYQRKIWVDCRFHLGKLAVGIENVCVVSLAGKIPALFYNIK